MSSDAADIVMPSKHGAARAMAGALADAGSTADDVGYINAHGTGTAANDKTECAAVADVFGPHADRLMISFDQVDAWPSDRRHRRGRAAGLHHGAARRRHRAHHRLRGTRPGMRAGRGARTRRARPGVTVALSNAFAFGGMNAVLALRRDLNEKRAPDTGPGAVSITCRCRCLLRRTTATLS